MFQTHRIPTLAATALLCTLTVAFGAGCGDDDPVASSIDPVVQLDLSARFNSDVVVNGVAGSIDSTQEAVDDTLQGNFANYALITQSAAAALGATEPNGMPDDGLFPATSAHPAIRLAYRNGHDGHNAFRFLEDGDEIEIDVPDWNYEKVHLFALSGQGSTNLEVTFEYDDGSTETATINVPDWFNEITPDATRYYLIDGMDRARRTGAHFDERDDAAVFGFALSPDPEKELDSVTVEQIGATASGTVCTLMGATAERAERED